MGGGVPRGRAEAGGDGHELCRCTCKMARARFYQVWRTRRRGRRQTAGKLDAMLAGVNDVACARLLRYWAAAMRPCGSALLTTRSCELSLARALLLGADSTPTRAALARS